MGQHIGQVDQIAEPFTARDVVFAYRPNEGLGKVSLARQFSTDRAVIETEHSLLRFMHKRTGDCLARQHLLVGVTEIGGQRQLAEVVQQPCREGLLRIAAQLKGQSAGKGAGGEGVRQSCAPSSSPSFTAK